MTANEFAKVDELVKFFKNKFNLNDWDIQIESSSDLEPLGEIFNASIEYNPNIKKALLSVFRYKPDELDNSMCRGVEKTIMHELLHLKLWFADYGEENETKNVLIENFINDIVQLIKID